MDFNEIYEGGGEEERSFSTANGWRGTTMNQFMTKKFSELAIFGATSELPRNEIPARVRNARGLARIKKSGPASSGAHAASVSDERQYEASKDA